MASRVSDLPHQRGFAGEIKSKNVAGHGRQNRKVLGDIGNLVTGRDVVTGKDVAKKAKPQQTKAEVVIVISPDENEKSCKPHFSRRTHTRGTKTFTATLRARSKAAATASGVKENVKEEDPVVDIDAVDADNELAAVEYVDDIFKYYKTVEEEGGIKDYIGSQPEINEKMRSILIDWLVDVHRKFELMPETLYLTINLVDRFLSLAMVPRRELQLLGLGAMLIACKYEEIWAPEVNDFVCISDNAYCRKQVLAMEKSILGKVEWYITVPTPYVFLGRYVKASVPCDIEMEKLVFYLAELGLMQYPLVVLNRPSMLAASAVYAARQTLGKTPVWTETLKHHTGYLEDEIMEHAKMLMKLRDSASESTLTAVFKKHSVSENAEVALLSSLED
ncbi:PREDICTED: cyclin-B1-4-like [Camelina sativa]|uniref:Cyclin-B1-4-like n=1 Tax=Camelina sativa TaxID=90675 RepID=A0ABM0SY49_CAMSA|nr:PREDICTED: cyclin-B1-4-like [Camelina sativa]